MALMKLLKAVGIYDVFAEYRKSFSNLKDKLLKDLICVKSYESYLLDYNFSCKSN